MLLHGWFSNQLILKPVVGRAHSAMATLADASVQRPVFVTE